MFGRKQFLLDAANAEIEMLEGLISSFVRYAPLGTFRQDMGGNYIPNVVSLFSRYVHRLEREHKERQKLDEFRAMLAKAQATEEHKF